MSHGVAPVQHAPDRIAYGGSVGKDLFHPRIRFERLALADADRCQLARKFHVVTGRRLLLHVLVDHLKEPVIARRNCIERFSARFDELGLRDRRIYLEADVAFEGRCDARSEPAGRIG